MKENIEIAKAVVVSVGSTLYAEGLCAKRSGDTFSASFCKSLSDNLQIAIKELDQCSPSSAGCLDANATTCPAPSSAHCSPQASGNSEAKDSTAAPDAATPAKLSWCKLSETTPPDGCYPTRVKRIGYGGCFRRVTNGKWEKMIDDPDFIASLEYFPIHLLDDPARSEGNSGGGR